MARFPSKTLASVSPYFDTLRLPARFLPGNLAILFGCEIGYWL